VCGIHQQQYPRRPFLSGSTAAGILTSTSDAAETCTVRGHRRGPPPPDRLAVSLGEYHLRREATRQDRQPHAPPVQPRHLPTGFTQPTSGQGSA
jgi:hypothetical protein